MFYFHTSEKYSDFEYEIEMYDVIQKVKNILFFSKTLFVMTSNFIKKLIFTFEQSTLYLSTFWVLSPIIM